MVHSLHLQLLKLLPLSRPPLAPGALRSSLKCWLSVLSPTGNHTGNPPAAGGLVTCPPPCLLQYLSGAFLRPLMAHSSALTASDVGAAINVSTLWRFTDPAGQRPSRIYVAHPHDQIQHLSHARCSLNLSQYYQVPSPIQTPKCTDWNRSDTRSDSCGRGWFAKKGSCFVLARGAEEAGRLRWRWEEGSRTGEMLAGNRKRACLLVGTIWKSAGGTLRNVDWGGRRGRRRDCCWRPLE